MGKRICTECKLELPINMFHKMGKYPNGVQRYKAKCKDCISTLLKRARLDDPAKFRASSKLWRDANPEKVRESINKCRAAKPDQYKATMKAWEKRNPDKVAAKSKKYREKHPEVFAAHSAKRRATKQKATPQWSETTNIRVMYLDAKIQSDNTGLTYEVDHIIPLQSNLVCGLHCLDNLRVISSIDNRTKSNYYWPDMW